ncbi:MAG TPA: cold shock domain-containing protein [Pirellulales bacterium]|nr:cold shock domain-containing protein [Pirellulales bacterium]
MLDAKIRAISADRGFGFLQPATGGPDLFFHYRVVDADFASLTVGQNVRYEVDEAAEKPRAKSVITGNSAAPRKPGHSQSGDRPSSPHRSSRNQRAVTEVKNYDFGFITKLPRGTMEGYISSVKGGREYFFEATDMADVAKFYRLAIGDYVRFIPEPNDDDPKRPLARSVVTARLAVAAPEHLVRKHPRSRGRKPTWR